MRWLFTIVSLGFIGLVTLGGCIIVFWLLLEVIVPLLSWFLGV